MLTGYFGFYVFLCEVLHLRTERSLFIITQYVETSSLWFGIGRV